MPDLTAQQVIETVAALEADFGTFRKQAQAFLDLYAMRRKPKLVPEMTRTGQVNVVSPELLTTAHTVRADLLGAPTDFQVAPTARDEAGSILDEHKKKADALEKARAIGWNKLDRDRVLSSDVIWCQLVMPVAVVILEMDEIKGPTLADGSTQDKAKAVDRFKMDNYPFRAFCADPFSCAWTVRDALPTLGARRYKQTVWNVEDKYPYRLGADGGWKPIDDDVAASGGARTLGKGAFEQAEMLWFATPTEIYHVAMDMKAGRGKNKSGEIVWSGPNPFGRVPLFLVPGNLTPLRKPEDRYEPHLFGFGWLIEQRNTIRTQRATLSKNQGAPQTYVDPEPTVMAAYLQTHGGELPGELTFSPGRTPYLLGEVKEWPAHVDPDLDKLEAAIEHEIELVRPSSISHLSDPEVLKATTSSGLLTAIESAMRTLGPLVDHYDSQKCAIMDAIDHAANHHGSSEYPIILAATGQEQVKGKKVDSNVVVKLDEESLDFPHATAVTTRPLDEAKARARLRYVYDHWLLPDGSHGPFTWDDLLDAANVTDPTAQNLELAIEGIVDKAEPWIDEMAQVAVANDILLDMGLMVPMEATSGMQPPAAPAAPGGPEGGSGITMNTPNVPAPPAQGPSAPMAGGSGGAVMP